MREKISVIDTRTGVITLSDGLTIYPGFSFDEFKRTRFYKNQDGIKIICKRQIAQWLYNARQKNRK